VIFVHNFSIFIVEQKGAAKSSASKVKKPCRFLSSGRGIIFIGICPYLVTDNISRPMTRIQKKVCRYSRIDLSQKSSQKTTIFGKFIRGVKMKRIFTITGVAFCLFIIDSYTAKKTISGQTWTNSIGLSRNEINSLAAVQIILLKENKFVSGGSGFFVNEDGYIITANHVIELSNNNREIRTLVNFEQGLYPVEVIAFNDNKDIAILRVTVTAPLSFVTFEASDTIIPQSNLTFYALPPTVETSSNLSFAGRQNPIVSENHRIIGIKSSEDILSDPDTKAFIKDEEVQKILLNPSTPSLVSDPMVKKYLPYPMEIIDLLTFFLANRESRIFFSDPDKRTKSGWSGSAGFNDAGYCIGMLQEIIAVFKPNPMSRYIDPHKPPSDNSRFPILDTLIGAGQNSNSIMSFLTWNGIKFFRNIEQPSAFHDSWN